jgi:DNA topoisomerase I
MEKSEAGLSAGRVQSVAVRLIVEREEEVKNFPVESVYKVVGKFRLIKNQSISIQAELDKRFMSKEESKAFLELCIPAEFVITSVEKKPGKKSPAPPFTTSTLQQEASRKLGFSVAKTMLVAQQLYESGRITYMRTDSVNLSSLALNKAQEVIEKIMVRTICENQAICNQIKICSGGTRSDPAHVS